MNIYDLPDSSFPFIATIDEYIFHNNISDANGNPVGKGLGKATTGATDLSGLPFTVPQGIARAIITPITPLSSAASPVPLDQSTVWVANWVTVDGQDWVGRNVPAFNGSQVLLGPIIDVPAGASTQPVFLVIG